MSLLFPLVLFSFSKIHFFCVRYFFHNFYDYFSPNQFAPFHKYKCSHQKKNHRMCWWTKTPMFVVESLFINHYNITSTFILKKLSFLFSILFICIRIDWSWLLVCLTLYKINHANVLYLASLIVVIIFFQELILLLQLPMIPKYHE